jgi:hypothetical protein
MCRLNCITSRYESDFRYFLCNIVTIYPYIMYVGVVATGKVTLWSAVIITVTMSITKSLTVNHWGRSAAGGAKFKNLSVALF